MQTKRRGVFAVFITCALSLCFATVGTIATIRVPEDQPTIQAGIDVAQVGDLVLVSPGTYTETLNLSGKTITLASSIKPSSTEPAPPLSP